MSDDDHALLSASSSHRWATCAASLRLESGLPRSTSRYAAEGTCAHTLGSWCLSTGKHPRDYPQSAIEADGMTFKVDNEMIAAVEAYVNRVNSYLGDGQLLVEQRVNYSSWIGIDTELGWGTSDAVILHEEKCVIVDLKYGQGVRVDAQDNEQLMLYALGALYEYEGLGDFRHVTMVICQPRMGHWDEHTIDVTDLKTFALNMKAKALTALKVLHAPQAPLLEQFTPDDSACRFCGAKATCPALQAEVETETRDFFSSLVEQPTQNALAPVVPTSFPMALVPGDIPEDNLGRMMGLVDRFEAFCKAVRAEAERRLLAGHPVPGWKLVEGRRGAREWADPEAALRLLKRKLGARNAIKDPEPISPTEAEKRLKTVDPSIYEKSVKKLVTQTDGKPSVAPDSDKRPALSMGSVTEEFAKLASVEDLV